MKNFSKIFDISLPIYQGMIIYPGNPPVIIKAARGKTSTHSKITIGSHTGTHIDALSHVFRRGGALDKIDLNKLIGTCRVLNMVHVKECISKQNLVKEKIKSGEKILVKTKNSLRGYKKFYNNYIYLSGEAADFLASKKISLFGIDYLSVKKRGGNDLRPHNALLKNKIVIFEGLNLSKVKAGKYFFIGLPLKFINIDGSPSRAILLK